jgi:hypothetical protein
MRRGFLVIAIAVLTVGLVACASAPPAAPPAGPLAWVRTDGQSGRSNPALADQFAADQAACGLPSGTSDNTTLQVAQGCMGKRGYALVSADQADAAAATFRADAAAKAHYSTPQ